MAQKVQGRQNIVKSYSFLLLFLFFFNWQSKSAWKGVGRRTFI